MRQRIGPYLLHVTIEMEPEWEDDINTWYSEEHVPEIMNVPGMISARRFALLGDNSSRWPAKYLCIYEMANEHIVLGKEYLRYHTGWKGTPSLRTEWTHRSSQHYRTHRSVRRQVFPEHGSYTDTSGTAGREPVPGPGSSLEDNWSRPIGSAIWHVSFTPDPEHEPETLAWYDQRYLPTLMACPGFLGARRFGLHYDPDRGEPSVVGHHKHLLVFDVADADALASPELAAAFELLAAEREGIPVVGFERPQPFVQTFPQFGAYELHAGTNAYLAQKNL